MAAKKYVWIVVPKYGKKYIVGRFSAEETAKNYVQTLNAPFNYLIKKQAVESDPEMKSNPVKKKFSPAQIAAQKLFAERARAGTLGKGKRKANPVNSNKPMAAQGLISYRYKGRYGFIMIGARDDKDALNEAKRSTRDAVSLENLEVWNGKKYEFVVKPNPDKSKPRAYVMRASQTTGRPPVKGTKAGNRLITRRKKALSAPAGYFPNPKVKYTNRAKDLKGEQRVGYSVHRADAPSYLAIAWFSKKSDAVQVAQEASDRTGKQLAVTRVQNYFGPM